MKFLVFHKKRHQSLITITTGFSDRAVKNRPKCISLTTADQVIQVLNPNYQLAEAHAITLTHT